MNEILKERRKKIGFSSKQMAKQLDISIPFYSQIENGQRRLTYDMAVKIALVLKTKPDKLFFEEYVSLLNEEQKFLDC